MKKGCVALSMQLHTGIDYLLAMPVGELQELADSLVNISKEVARRGK